MGKLKCSQARGVACDIPDWKQIMEMSQDVALWYCLLLLYFLLGAGKCGYECKNEHKISGLSNAKNLNTGNRNEIVHSNGIKFSFQDMLENGVGSVCSWEEEN